MGKIKKLEEANPFLRYTKEQVELDESLAKENRKIFMMLLENQQALTHQFIEFMNPPIYVKAVCGEKDDE